MTVKKPTDVELALARAMFRNDKWSPGRNREEEFTWDQYRNRYLVSATRLLRTFDKDGLQLALVSPGSND